jgi:hypothetical protein
MNKTLNYWQTILNSLGFDIKYYQYIDTELCQTDWYNKDEHIIVCTKYTVEYNEYLKSLPEGIEILPSFDNCIVNSIILETNEFALPECGYEDGNYKGGITLEYGELTIDNLKKALEMIRNPISSKIKIVKRFIEEYEKFPYKKTLNKLGFIEKSTSLLLIGKVAICSEPYFTYTLDNKVSLNIYYNIFEDKLYVLNNANIIYINHINENKFIEIVKNKQ